MTDQLIDEKPAYESEFGKGYAYCLGLFLAHEWKMFQDKEMEKKFPGRYCMASMWFNGAADHLFELEIPAALSEEKQKEIAEFKQKCLDWRLEDCTWEDAKWALDTAKALLLEWDRFCNIPAEKGGWQ